MCQIRIHIFLHSWTYICSDAIYTAYPIDSSLCYWPLDLSGLHSNKTKYFIHPIFKSILKLYVDLCIYSLNSEGYHFSWNVSSCRRSSISFVRGPKPRDIRSKKVRRVPTEQSQIYIKRPRVSGTLLTIIPSHDCRAVEYETTDQSRDEIKWSKYAPRWANLSFKF